MNKKDIVRNDWFLRLYRKVNAIIYRHKNYREIISDDTPEWDIMKYIETSRLFSKELDDIYLDILKKWEN